MTDLIVDNCFIVAVLVEEEHSEFAREILLALEDRAFRAPALIIWEFANTLLVKSRRGAMPEANRAARLAGFAQLDIAFEPLPDPAQRAELDQLCRRTGLSAYDGAYLQLALALGAELATLDRRLAKAARDSGVTVHAPF